MRVGEITPRSRVACCAILRSAGANCSMGVHFTVAAKLPILSNPMKPDQLDALALAISVVSSGPSGVYSLEVLEKLRRASGLHQHYGHECAQAILVDAIARRGFFAAKRVRRAKA